MLWHGDEPIGICIFSTPAASLALRTHAFGLKNPRDRVALAALNRQLWLLSRVVLHPTWRGAGIAAAFVRAACSLCPVPWIETLSAMGHANPFFEHAGFRRIGIVQHTGKPSGSAYSQRTAAAHRHRFSQPVYYLRDNRPAHSDNATDR
jgi:GNAT superfamily N-acetyltransferase